MANVPTPAEVSKLGRRKLGVTVSGEGSGCAHVAEAAAERANNVSS